MHSIILVAGISCSGKTTLARRLASELDAAYLSIDDYYRPFTELPLDERKKVNFDAPDAIEHELLVDHVGQLRRGETIHKPMYDAAAYARMRGSEPIYPTPMIVIEGLFALYWSALREHSRLGVFVETPLEVCRERRLDRDVHHYGRSRLDAIEMYESHVHPNQAQFVLPSREVSDVIVSGTQPLDRSLQQIYEFFDGFQLVR